MDALNVSHDPEQDARNRLFDALSSELDDALELARVRRPFDAADAIARARATLTELRSLKGGEP